MCTNNWPILCFEFGCVLIIELITPTFRRLPSMLLSVDVGVFSSIQRIVAAIAALNVHLSQASQSTAFLNVAINMESQ